MPIINRTNARVLNPNARAVDVARAALEVITPVQQRKADAAFQVNGYSGILYSYLDFGTPCACKAKSRAIFSRLDQDGKASIGTINEMLNPNNNFGIRPYGEKRLPTQAYVRQANIGYSFLEVNVGQKPDAAVPLASLFDEEDLDTSNRSTAGLPRVTIGTEEDSNQGNLVVDIDPETQVENQVSDFDTGLFGMTDAACPICFGSGFIGGYNPMNAYRKVLTFQDPTMVIPAGALIEDDKEIPIIFADSVSWTTLLPAGVLGVDALRLWHLDKQLSGFALTIDGTAVSKELEVLLYCDGREHTISVTFAEQTYFTHMEIQLNQTDLLANFELPRLNKSSNLSLRERTDPFTINLSPRIPYVKALDVIVESTYGKVLQVKSVTGLNDKRQSSLAWDAEVRPTQPQELFNLLPRRHPTSRLNKPSIVRDQASPNGMLPRT